ncbi:hypothetical protein CAP36_03880 [Chitinophagaceae bacterium IBVUCB2]|nr:hypothetical protein CAP36_03880 [Chitinophagaceae bacterium IBVUCB2]
MKKIIQSTYFFLFCVLVFISCKEKSSSPDEKTITAIDLKRGDVVLCGPPDKEFGSVAFISSCSDKVKKDFNLALALLHSFEYDEAEKVFAKVIDIDPTCAMAYWGVAMSNYHPLWAPPTEAELKKGAKAIAIAQTLSPKSKNESAYIEAMATLYKDWKTTTHATRSSNYERAMGKIYTEYPSEKEAAIFYALALDGTADPADKSYKNQKKAAAILNALYPGEPNHPGIVHYIIHTYDSPELASLGLEAARKYASVAPSSAHAQHMPSHIFTRLGLWDECINSNRIAAASAKCYAENTGMKGHWDEELHALDYLVYSYLQKGDNKSAKEQWDYLVSFKDVFPVNFKVAYAYASIPSRYVLENKMWKEAAAIQPHSTIVSWEKFPWQKGIIHFARLMGSVNTGNIDAARNELKNLSDLQNLLTQQKDSYKANQLQIQMKTGEAWILFKEGKGNEALNLMNSAADMEDKTEKHAVTPAEVLPARELLADMLLQLNKPADALTMYEAVLKKQPNRFNGLYGAAVASEKSNNSEKAISYYRQLLSIATTSGSSRPELENAKSFLKKNNSTL